MGGRQWRCGNARATPSTAPCGLHARSGEQASACDARTGIGREEEDRREMAKEQVVPLAKRIVLVLTILLFRFVSLQSATRRSKRRYEAARLSSRLARNLARVVWCVERTSHRLLPAHAPLTGGIRHDTLTPHARRARTHKHRARRAHIRPSHIPRAPIRRHYELGAARYYPRAKLKAEQRSVPASR